MVFLSLFFAVYFRNKVFKNYVIAEGFNSFHFGIASYRPSKNGKLGFCDLFAGQVVGVECDKVRRGDLVDVEGVKRSSSYKAGHRFLGENFGKLTSYKSRCVGLEVFYGVGIERLNCKLAVVGG